MNCWREFVLFSCDHNNAPDYVVEPGRLDKGKLHCSCWMCSGSQKTSYAGNRISEQRKMLRERDETDDDGI